MVRPPKPELASGEEHKPQGDLPLMSPGCFTPGQQRLPSPKDSKTKCSSLHSLWLTYPWKEQRPCSTSLLKERGPPFPPLTSTPHLPQNLFFFSPWARLSEAREPQRRYEKGFSSLMVMAFAPAAREPLGKGESFISALPLYHSIKHRSCSAEPRTGLGIGKSTTPCTQGAHRHDSKASGQL